jgi:hypothetical protein
MNCKPIPAKDVAASIMKIMDEVASEYPEEEREELKAIMLGSLGMALFNGPTIITNQTFSTQTKAQNGNS